MTDAWTQRDQPPLLDRGGGPVTLVEGSSFVISGRGGDIRPDQPEGLFFLDTRLLSDWQLRVNGLRPEPLAVTSEGPHVATFVSRVRPDLRDGSVTLLIVRRRYVGRGMREDVSIRNYGRAPVDISIALFCDADFADLFEVKGGRGHGTRDHTRSTEAGAAVYRHFRGATRRSVRIVFTDSPSWESDAAVWQVSIPPRGEWSCCAYLEATVGDQLIESRYRCGDPPAAALPSRRLARWQETVPRLQSDHEPLVQAFSRSLEDLGSLRIEDAAHPDRTVVAAGAPWFMTLFGRDSILTAWMALIVDPSLALGVCQTLASLQGKVVVPDTEEEPGRILHEVRFSESMSMSLGDGQIYYGTADATPLFVMLLGELARWGHRPDVVQRLVPHADRALAWIESFGDRDGDGYVEYARETPHGLANQGWKDSWDGITRADGAIPHAPIALCEVQAYVYGAYVARAHLAREAGDTATERRYLAKASSLADAFERDFWLEDRGWYALGLDDEKQPIDALASNMGHCLWTGIVRPDRAVSIVRHMMSPEMFSGWGVRTLAATMDRYDPLSYHNGSVWPHDNAILAAGLMRYGFVEEAHRVILAMLDTASASNGRLPELFAGVGRKDVTVPVAYPTSCSPQAWAAAAPLLFVRSMLRLEPAHSRGQVWCAPVLPEGMGRLSLEGIPLGDRRLSVVVEGQDWEVQGLDGGLELVREAREPRPSTVA